MDWLINLFTNTESVAHIAILYAIVIAVGVLLGKIKVGGISLGVTFVLFAGIVAGHIGQTAPLNILTFLQDFGLILFVFMIGLQVGPGFFASFRKGGITLNVLACAAILLNIGVMFACYFIFFDTSDPKNLPMMVGTLYGAVTNTPGLGAATEALDSVFPKGQAPQIASGYACAYPLGVLGIIGATILLRYICHISLDKEEEVLNKESEEDAHVKPHNMHLRVTNSYLAGRSIKQIHDFLNRDFVCSRVLHDGHVSIPNGQTTLELGDIVFIVCAEADAEAIKAFIGPEEQVEWEKQDQPMVSKRIVVTRPSINGKTLGQMHFSTVYGVNVTRVTRQGMDLFANPHLALQVGDRVMVVGPENLVKRAWQLDKAARQPQHRHNIHRHHSRHIVWQPAICSAGNAHAAETRHSRRPARHSHTHRALRLQGTPCDIHNHQRQHHASRDWPCALPCQRRHQGRRGFLGHCRQGRRPEIRLHWLHNNGDTYTYSRNDSKAEIQIQLFHDNGHDCRNIYRPASIGLCQPVVLERGACSGLLYGLSA